MRASDTRRYETADHCWKYNHDFDWENKKIMDYEANTTRRKIKETIHSLSNNNHINEISYRLQHIWFSALKLKGGSEVNTSFNLNEETNNQSQASSISIVLNCFLLQKVNLNCKVISIICLDLLSYFTQTSAHLFRVCNFVNKFLRILNK